MRIISISFSEISAERKTSLKNNMEIKTNLSIEDIKKEEIEISKNPAINFSFSYVVNYEPSIGKVTLRGNVVAIDEKNEAESILKEWKKKLFSHEIKLQLFNMILNKCNAKSIQMEEELGLPFHVPFPQINPGQADAKLSSSSQSESNKKHVNYTG
jgi:hypothetical protein